jgi:hypothetical protein
MTTKLLIIVAFSVAACGAPPTAPSVVEFREGGTGPTLILDHCSIPVSCTVTRRIQNVGNTCATDVHATIAPLDPGGNVLATYSWVHIPNTVVVRPLDSVEIRLVDVPYAVTQAAARWRITPGWRQTACP